MSQCLGETAKSIYIDPPYNTGASAILYKNSYKHSSWGALMLDRILRLRDLLSAKGVIFVSIDKIERTLLEACLDTAFGRDNRIEELIWTQNTANGQLPTYSTNHEYVEAYAKDRGAVEADGTLFREQKPGYPEIMDIVVRLNPEYPPLHEVEAAIKNLFKTHIAHLREDIEASGEEWSDEAAKQDPWKGIYNYCHAEYRDEAGALVPEADARQKRAKIWIWREISPSAPAAKQSPSTKDPNDHNFRYYRPLHPITKKPCPHPKGGWKFPLLPDPDNPDRKSFTQLEADNRIAWGEDEKKVPQTKGFLHEVETNISTSVFYEYNDGEAEVSSLFNKTGLFLAPKSSIFVKRFINQTIRHDGELFIDCFGGSGSSAHAAIDFTRDTSKKLRYLISPILSNQVDGLICDQRFDPRAVFRGQQRQVRFANFCQRYGNGDGLRRVEVVGWCERAAGKKQRECLQHARLAGIVLAGKAHERRQRHLDLFERAVVCDFEVL